MLTEKSAAAIRKANYRLRKRDGVATRNRAASRARLTGAQSAAELDAARATPDPLATLRSKFGDSMPTTARQFTVRLDVLLRFLMIAEQIQAKTGQNQTDSASDALAQWCERQENEA